jgi:superfamily II DNA helicase RecQ
MSPELAVSDRLRKMILEPRFKDRLALVVVDEAHLVQLWGIKFRSDYAQLNLLRSLLGRQVPWYVCSATLDSSTLKAVIKGIDLDADIKILRTSIDRPELLHQVGIIPERTRKKYSALRFLFDNESPSEDDTKVNPDQIPKTIVFFDSKREAHEASDALQYYLQRHESHQYSTTRVKQVIKVFTRDSHDSDKQYIISELQKEGFLSSIRVVFATEALGLGVDLPDIRRVVQYGIPKSLYAAVFLQRGGRAGGDGSDGKIIFLIDEWAVGERAVPPRNKQASLNEEEMEDILQESDEEDHTSSPHTKTRGLPIYPRLNDVRDCQVFGII